MLRSVPPTPLCISRRMIHERTGNFLSFALYVGNWMVSALLCSLTRQTAGAGSGFECSGGYLVCSQPNKCHHAAPVGYISICMTKEGYVSNHVNEIECPLRIASTKRSKSHTAFRLNNDRLDELENMIVVSVFGG